LNSFEELINIFPNLDKEIDNYELLKNINSFSDEDFKVIFQDSKTAEVFIFNLEGML
jgi:hypothetical protein